MKIVEFKSKRLFWLLYMVPLIVFLAPNPYEYYLEDGIFHGLRGVLTIGGSIGCLFYSIGARVFTRKFWQGYFILMVVDELYTVIFEIELDMPIFPIGVIMYVILVYLIVPSYIMLFLYAFRNTSIWKDSLDNQIQLTAEKSAD